MRSGAADQAQLPGWVSCLVRPATTADGGVGQGHRGWLLPGRDQAPGALGAVVGQQAECPDRLVAEPGAQAGEQQLGVFALEARCRRRGRWRPGGEPRVVGLEHQRVTGPGKA